ncbi:MAG: acetylxylan esterase [Pirellulales bacterium]
MRTSSHLLAWCLHAGLLLILPSTSALAAEPAADANASAMLDRYYERLSAPHHLKFTSLDDWKARRAELRKLVVRDLSLDPLPEKLPLNVTYGGQLDRGDYLVKRVYWQTWPGVYASGYLYLPKTPGKHPAILNPHGHWANGARHPVVQSRCIGQAKKGYVNLAVDSVHMPTEGFLVGVSSMTVMMFNAIRAVDLLESLPEVDAARIGCTGASGGGQQTMFMMAIDDRIAAAVPAVLVSYYRRIMAPAGFPHCNCNIVPGLLRDADEPEMAAIFAPKPVLYECVTGDWTRDFPKEEFPELRAIHALYGAAADIDVQQWDSPHDYSKPMRERMYAFFNLYLKNVTDPAAAAEPDLKVETLETLAALDKPPAGAKPFESVIDWYKAKYAFQPVGAKDAAGWQEYQRELRGRLAELVGDVKAQGKLVRRQAAEILGQKAARLSVQSEEGIQVPVVLIAPKGAMRSPLVVLIHDRGEKGVVEGYAGLVSALVAKEAAVAVADVRLTGALQRNWSLDCVLWGRPEVGMAVTDLGACLDVLAQEPGVDGRRVVLLGLGTSGASTLFAGAMEPRFSAVAVEDLGPTYLEGRKTPLIANLLRVADTPQLVAAVAPRSVLVGSARADAYRFAGEAYRGVNAESTLEMRGEKLTAEEISAWAMKE